MAPRLKTRLAALHGELARLQHDPDALWDYYQDIERRIALLPALRETLRLAQQSVRAARLSEREAELGVATLCTQSVLLLAQLCHEEGLEMAAQLYGPHPATLHARDKQALLPEGVHVQKTVSLLLGDRLVLVSSVGDQVLTRTARRAIAERLQLPRRLGTHATINPPSCIAEQELGLLRGMVSPFLPAGFGTNLDALVHLCWPDAWEEEDQRVAISLSPCESLLVPLRCYRRILRRYARHSLPSIPLVELHQTEEQPATVCHATGVESHAATPPA